MAAQVLVKLSFSDNYTNDIRQPEVVGEIEGIGFKKRL